MPSLISQMRNGQQPQLGQTQSLDSSIQQVKGMMHQLKMASNPQQALMGMIQQNPQFAQIAQMMKTNPNGLEGVARQMAQANGVDLNNLVKQLGGV